MDLVMLGLPGAGKGTQAERLARDLGHPWIATGDLLREARREGTPLGRKAAAFMDQGKLVPDEVVVGLVEERLRREDARQGFVLDGFPRNTAQADALDESLEDLDRSLDVVLFLDVPEEEVVRRLSRRLVCGDCGKLQGPTTEEGISAEDRCPDCGGGLVERADDDPEVVRGRLRVYRRQTEPLLERYQGRGILRRVNGVGNPDEVGRRVRRAVETSEGLPEQETA